jgi:hypothetical protein
MYGIEQLSQDISKQRGTWGKPALNKKEKQEQEQKPSGLDDTDTHTHQYLETFNSNVYSYTEQPL